MSEQIPEGLCQCGCGAATRLVTATDRRRGIVRDQPRRFLPGHNMKQGLPPEYREVDLGFLTPCWIWQRGKTTAGYGHLRRDGKAVYAHRLAYERAYGEIPEGWVVHHQCWNKACVNPDHLIAATLVANNQGCLDGPENALPRDRWIHRPRKRHYSKLRDGELPYEVVAGPLASKCWIWTRACGKGGYPRMWIAGRDTYAHRVYLENSRGPIPDGLVLDHTCGSASCVNPEHLEPVTQKENLRRKVERQKAETLRRLKADAA